MPGLERRPFIKLSFYMLIVTAYFESELGIVKLGSSNGDEAVPAPRELRLNSEREREGCTSRGTVSRQPVSTIVNIGILHAEGVKMPSAKRP